MIRKCVALIVPARLSEDVRLETIDTRQGTMQALFGVDLECVEHGDWHVYLTAGSAGTNVRAGHLLHDAGLDLHVATTAVFLGRAEHHNDDTHVPLHLIRRAESLFGIHLEGSAQPAA